MPITWYKYPILIFCSQSLTGMWSCHDDCNGLNCQTEVSKEIRSDCKRALENNQGFHLLWRVLFRRRWPQRISRRASGSDHSRYRTSQKGHLAMLLRGRSPKSHSCSSTTSPWFLCELSFLGCIPVSPHSAWPQKLNNQQDQSSLDRIHRCTAHPVTWLKTKLSALVWYDLMSIRVKSRCLERKSNLCKQNGASWINFPEARPSARMHLCRVLIASYTAAWRGLVYWNK